MHTLRSAAVRETQPTSHGIATVASNNGKEGNSLVSEKKKTQKRKKKKMIQSEHNKRNDH
jgi:hypothetical protein